MNSDYGLLLSTVLSERGCADASLQHTAETVPLVYRALAEHNYYLLYTVSVVKALLREEEGAFAQLAYAQVQRQEHLHQEGAGSRSTPPVTGLTPPSLSPISPSDALDMQLTIVGGGSCCELMLRLICGSAGGRDAANRAASQEPLVHPSRITVITRQPARLAPFADLGVHCLTRHHGLQAVGQSDVVILAFPPAQLTEVKQDLFAPHNTGKAARVEGDHNAAASPPPPPNDAKLLRANAVLLSCLAGVPAKKVAQTFNHTPLGLTFAPTLHTYAGATAPVKASSYFGGEVASTSTMATSVASTVPPSLSPFSEMVRTEEHEGGGSCSLELAGQSFQQAMAAYRGARLAEMHSSISFLRPAVLEKATAAAAAADEAAVKDSAGHFWKYMLTRPPTTSGHHSIAVPPRLLDFTAGRHPSTSPTLAEYLEVWRVLRVYVQTTFAEEASKSSRNRGGGTGGDGNTGRHYGGLVSIVIPKTSSTQHNLTVAGEVEAELLPALTLLPPTKAKLLWDAWWGNGARVGTPGSVDTASAPAWLPSSVTRVTGVWLARVYASVAAFQNDLDEQYRRILGERTQ